MLISDGKPGGFYSISEQAPQLKGGESGACRDASLGNDWFSNQTFTSDVSGPRIGDNAGEHLSHGVPIKFSFLEQLVPLHMFKSLSNIKEELNVLFGIAGDGSYLHSPSGISNPSASRIVALGIGQLGRPFFDSMRTAFRIDPKDGAKEGNGSKPTIRLGYECSEHSLLGFGPLPLHLEASQQCSQAGESRVRQSAYVPRVHTVNARSLSFEAGRHQTHLVNVDKFGNFNLRKVVSALILAILVPPM